MELKIDQGKNWRYEYFNSFAVFDNNLNLINNYNKMNLVPFGEFIPFENIFHKFDLRIITNNISSFSRGSSREIIEIKKNFINLVFYHLFVLK